MISGIHRYADVVRAKNILFRGTIDGREGPGRMARFNAIEEFRREYAGMELGPAGAEIVGWNGFDGIMERFGRQNGGDLDEEECTVHYAYHFGETESGASGAAPYDMNLANSGTAALLKDGSSAFFRFLKAHRGVRNLSVHLCYSADRIEWAVKCEDPTQGKMRFPFPSKGSRSYHQREELLEMSVERLNDLKRTAKALGYEGEFLIENCAWEGLRDEAGVYRSAFDFVADADFILEVQRRTGYKLLLDVSHAFVHAFCVSRYARGSDPNRDRYSDPLVYVRDLVNSSNICDLYEVHASVPDVLTVRGEEFVIDRHLAFHNSAGRRDPVAAMLKYFVSLRCGREKDLPPLLINFEHGPEHWLKDAELLLGLIEDN